MKKIDHILKVFKENDIELIFTYKGWLIARTFLGRIEVCHIHKYTAIKKAAVKERANNGMWYKSPYVLFTGPECSNCGKSAPKPVLTAYNLLEKLDDPQL